jgi:NADPH:quinone reductase-like Zn-dependent oxidoreductase
MVSALAVAGRNEKATVQEVEVTAPGAGQVRVAVRAASVNGIDASVAAGYLWEMLPADFPVVLGRDFAGTVEAVGPDVTSFAAGDRVAGVITAMRLGAGAIGELVTVDAAGLVPIPAGVSDPQAAAVGLAAVTARDLVDALGLTDADVVLVSGATGGVGVFAVQLAAATGATVVATARPGAATDLVAGLGARHVVDHRGDLATAVGATGEKVTAVVHAAGNGADLAALLPAGGRLASALGVTGEQVGRADISVTPVMAMATPEKLGGLLQAVAEGRLRVPVAATYPLVEAAQGLVSFAGHKLGKLVISIG